MNLKNYKIQFSILIIMFKSSLESDMEILTETINQKKMKKIQYVSIAQAINLQTKQQNIKELKYQIVRKIANALPAITSKFDIENIINKMIKEPQKYQEEKKNLKLILQVYMQKRFHKNIPCMKDKSRSGLMQMNSISMHLSYINNNENRCLCLQNRKNLQKQYQCIICKKYFHQQCIKMVEKQIRENNIFQCPYCTIIRMDPLNQVIKVYFYNYIKFNKNQPICFQFNISPQDIQKYRNNPKFQLEIRCIRLDGVFNFEITWPDYGQIRLNQTKLMQFKPLLFNSSLHKRRDERIQLDLSQIKLLSNSIKIIENPMSRDFKKEYKIVQNSVFYLGVVLVRKLMPQQLITKLQRNQVQGIQQCKKILQLNFNSQIQIQNIVLSLKCQLTFTNILTPARGILCKHYQCFSLQNYINSIYKLIPRKWNCPICKRRCTQLKIDQYLNEILKKCRQKKLNFSEIKFFPNLSYQIEYDQVNSEEQNIEEEKLKLKALHEVINLQEQQKANELISKMKEPQIKVNQSQSRQEQNFVSKIVVERNNSLIKKKQSNSLSEFQKQVIEISSDQEQKKLKQLDNKIYKLQNELRTQQEIMVTVLGVYDLVRLLHKAKAKN